MNSILDDIKLAFRRTDNAHVKLVLINLAVFIGFHIVYQGSRLFGVGGLGELLSNQLSLPSDVGELVYRPWSLITYFFFHERIWHLVSNLLYLYWFGQVINEFLGPKRLTTIYFLGGVLGGLAYILAYNLLPGLQGYRGHVLLGASGAVFAVIAAAATLLPHYKFNLILIGPVSLIYIAGFLILLSFIEVSGSNPGGNIAHLGGALMGYIFVSQLRSGTDLGKPFAAIGQFFRGLFSGKPAKPLRKGTPRKPLSDLPDEAEIDAILDKIHHSGYESLNKEEKQRLFKFSQKG